MEKTNKQINKQNRKKRKIFLDCESEHCEYVICVLEDVTYGFHPIITIPEPAIN